MQTTHKDIYFGGPDLKKNALRNVLLESIQAVPAGGEITWMCYYLNEQSILNALINAAKNGVNITILIDKNPRTPDVNKESLSQLKKINEIKLIALQKKPFWEYFGINWHPHFHSKYYYFSHPAPHVYIGSYNPTAGINELGSEIINVIGDHSISHNLLVKINDISLVNQLQAHIYSLKKHITRYFARLLPSQNKAYKNENWEIDFLPRISRHPIISLMYKKDEHAKLKCAISHLKGPGIKKALLYALRNKSVEILYEPSQRRVSNDYIKFLQNNGAIVHQPKLPDHCLMHNKFILYETQQDKKVFFGSYNLSARSRLLNHEIIASINDSEVFRVFNLRWDIITQRNY